MIEVKGSKLKFYQEQVDKLFKGILYLSDKMKIEYIENFLEDIPTKVDEDLKAIKSVYLENRREIFKSEIKLILLKALSINKRMISKEIQDLNSKIEIFYVDLYRYNSNFSTYSEEIKNEIIMAFETFKKISLTNNERENIKDVYAFYQIMMIYLLFMLPKNYRNQVLEKENFEDLKQEINILNFNEEIESLGLKIFYMHIFEKKLKDFIQEKYNINLFEVIFENRNLELSRRKNNIY